jgi:hypothetical protein
MARSGLRRMPIVVVLVAAFAMQGCSAFQPKQQSVTIIAPDEGATIYVDNSPVGKSPVTIMLDRNKTYAVSASSGGTASIGRKISGTGVLDIVGTCLFIIPVIGLFTPGFWELDPTTVRIPAAAASRP